MKASAIPKVCAGYAWTATALSPKRCAFAAVLLLSSLLIGCAGKPAEVACVPAASAPPPAVARVVPDSVASAPAAANIIRDTRALERQARSYVGRPDSSPEVINQLSTLLVQTRRAVGRMAHNRTRQGYRASDVTAARVAADSLAAFLQTRTSASAAATPVPVAKAAPQPQSLRDSATPLPPAAVEELAQ